MRIVSAESIAYSRWALSSPRRGELIEDLEVHAVGSGQVDPLLEVAAAQLHGAPRAVVADGVGDRADAVDLQAPCPPDELDQQAHALVAGLAEAVEHRRLGPVAGAEAADEVEA